LPFFLLPFALSFFLFFAWNEVRSPKTAVKLRFHLSREPFRT
jgi:hypothetical protein